VAINNYRHYVSVLRRLPRAALRRIIRERCDGYANIRLRVAGKDGLEIGGPSALFGPNHLIPVYDICRSIDACNFSSQTIWSGSNDRKKIGVHLRNQFMAEASDLSAIPEGTYNFVLASHVLEHIANPLRALEEWKRVLLPGGMLLVVLPHKDGTFDHRRPFTSFDHIESDFQANTSEADLTHLDEILSHHDIEMDPPAGSWHQFRERCLQNPSIRAMHHHVFSPEVLIKMFARLRMRVLVVTFEHPYHLIVASEKLRAADSEEIESHNSTFIHLPTS
jgi:SAM-dependent methyltransferase